MTINVTAKSRTLANGTANDAVPVEANFVELYNNDATLAAGVNGILGDGSTHGGIDGKFLILRNSFAAIPASNDHQGLIANRGSSPDVAIRWNETTDRWQLTWDGTNYFDLFTVNGGTVSGATTFTGAVTLAAPATSANPLRVTDMRSVRGTGVPVYGSSTTLSVPGILETTLDGANLLFLATTATLDITTASAINGLARSSALTGTVNLSGTSVTGTGTSFTTDFVVGDVIYNNANGQARRITAIASNTGMTVESAFTNAVGVAYSRGGRAPSTWYNLYAISNGSTVGLLASTRNAAGGDTLVDLPSGYTISRQLPFAFRLDASQNIVPFVVAQGWPYRPRVMFRDFEESGAFQVLSGGTQLSFTGVSLSSLVPPVSRLASLQCRAFYSSNGANLELRTTGSGLTTGMRVSGATSANGNTSISFLDLLTDANQSIDYKMSGSGSSGAMYVRGFTVTEVA